MAELVLNDFTYDLDTSKVSIDGVDLTAAKFTEMEAKIWDTQFMRLFALGNDPVSTIMRAYRGHLFAAARIAKAALNEAVFAGVEGPASQMLFGELMAWHIHRTTDAGAETPSKNWIMSLTVDEDYWVGWGANNLNICNVDKDACVVAIGVADLTTNRAVRSIKFKIGDVDHKPIGVERRQLAPSGYRIPVIPIKTLIFTPRVTYQARTYSDAAITGGKLALVGLTYGLGSYMTNLYKATVSL